MNKSQDNLSDIDIQHFRNFDTSDGAPTFNDSATNNDSLSKHLAQINSANPMGSQLPTDLKNLSLQTTKDNKM